MERSAVRKYQLAQLEILKFFDQKCKELGLEYYLVFGTLLGAVRHGGFIPWDADIDIAMFRDHYEKMKKYFLMQPVPELFYQHYETERNHLSPHAVLKIKGTHVHFNRQSSSKYKPEYDGVYIDIFPIDNVLPDESKQLKQSGEIAKIRRLVTLKAAPVYAAHTSAFKRMGKRIISAALAPISFRYLYAKADRIMQKYDDIQTEQVAILTDPHVFKKQLFPREVFGKPRTISFENYSFMIPSDAEKFLQTRYGDYMKMPPENERWQYLDETLKEIDYGNTNFLQSINKE